MTDRTLIRKIVVSGDRKFPTNLEYGRVIDSIAIEKYYILHTEDNHWEENLFVFDHSADAMKALATAASHLAMGAGVPREFEKTVSATVKF